MTMPTILAVEDEPAILAEIAGGGLMLNELRQAIYVNPWVAALPGAMIFMTSLSFNLLSDGLRSAMDLKS